MMRTRTALASILLILSMLLGGQALAAGKHVHVRAHTPSRRLTVQLCSSTPLGVPALRPYAQGMRNAVQLAVISMRTKMQRAGITLLPPMQMDYAKADGSTYSPDKERSNALSCIQNPHALAYVGPVNSGAELVSEPVLNRAHLVQMGLGSFPGLTTPKPYFGTGGRASQEPATFHHQIPWVTMYRTDTTDAVQGPAAAIFAHTRLHANSYYLVDDKLTYGSGLAIAFNSEAHRLGMKQLGSGHIDSTSAASEAQTAQALAAEIVSKKPAVVFCGCDPETTVALPRDLRQHGFMNPYMGGDGYFSQSWISETGPGSVNNYCSSLGPPPQMTTPYFRTLYRRTFPSFYANPGIQNYDAMTYDGARIALVAILHAWKAGALTGSLTHMRTMVVKYVHSINYYGALGHTTFDNNGDTTNRIISLYKVNGSKWMFQQIVRPKFSPT